MGEATWKRTERAVAGRLGGRRVPVSGRGGGPDVEHSWLAIEVKSRRKLPQWLQKAMDQALAAARLSQLPVVVLHEHGQRHLNDLVLMRLHDFEAWFGGSLSDDGHGE